MRHFKTVPRSRVYRLLRKGEVRVNRKRVDAEYRIQEGDEVRLPPVRIDADRGAGPALEQPVGADRAGGHLSGPAFVGDRQARRGCGARRQRHEFRRYRGAASVTAARDLELVHRLDRDTSGCLLVARDRATLTALHALIRNGGMHKTYLALVAGSWQLGTKRIDAPLATDNRQHGERHVRVAAAGKDSVSVFKPVQFFGSLATLMEVDIPTGRTHQIRVHASFAGHPLLGDDKYGDRAAQCGLERPWTEAHLPACPIRGIRMAGFGRSLPCQRAVTRRIGGSARCHHAARSAQTRKTRDRRAKPAER